MHDHAKLDFSHSPWIDPYEPSIWEEGVKLFHGWLVKTFGEEYFSGYEVAQKLDVHRVIADEWLEITRQYELIKGEIQGHGDNEVWVYINRATPENTNVSLVVSPEIRQYDPWENRDFDGELPHAKFADHVIDKYYDVFIDEVLVITGKPRKNKGVRFRPIYFTEHPRYVATKAIKNIGERNFIGSDAAKLEWREAIAAKAFPKAAAV